MAYKIHVSLFYIYIPCNPVLGCWPQTITLFDREFPILYNFVQDGILNLCQPVLHIHFMLPCVRLMTLCDMESFILYYPALLCLSNSCQPVLHKYSMLPCVRLYDTVDDTDGILYYILPCVTLYINSMSTCVTFTFYTTLSWTVGQRL